ncbi:folylpolyglutamate synthase/dihydrofolate synthase family protein [Pedobacter sp.]|jgi:dihydrofolate synthase/folylpolyglutamate synthase|uniref:bifunctional folylpolyglutamate synthase/dihydrofolate synthase n=1 Tax=Pedobacter sp. TaxID=1411316 RepID=UPI002CFA6BBC|nr:folylpolyglutamate synthase/dihydrofolate synthase family protein [Pedobacter sp.]HWW42422.1 folylpolyglutamate synthase/dihydrofolate synthase family protein [Pedobacter sp.]
MTYPQTLDYLYSKLPMFTRIGAVAFKKDLHNTLAMCQELGNPQHKFKTIHVAGTNGKGSTSHMLAAILQQAGYKTGLYTSPHLKDFRERIRVNGKMVSKRFVTNFVAQQQAIIESLQPSFFEVTVAMAFSCFAEEKVDIAIIEVGLGGRLDSTNIITPEVSVITNISLDHTNMLGNTLKEIAFEKAGIIKPGIPAVIGEHHPETDPVFIQKATETGSPLFFAEDELTLASTRNSKAYLITSILNPSGILHKDLQLDLTGTYQLKNILTVIQTVQLLKKLHYAISDEALFKALRNVKKITGLQGRWQILSHSPLIIADTGHNIAGITEVLQNIRNTSHQQLHMVIGMVKDKDINGVLSLLPKDAVYYFTQPDLERALPAEELASQGEQHELKGKTFKIIKDALNTAKAAALPGDLIFVGGSTFVVAEVI